MPDYSSDVNNPNNPAYGSPERHPHYGRPWLDPASDDEDDLSDGATGALPSAGDRADVSDDVGRAHLLASDGDSGMFLRLHAPLYALHGHSSFKVIESDLLLNLNWIGSVRHGMTSAVVRRTAGHSAAGVEDEVPGGAPTLSLYVEGDPLIELMVATRPLTLVFPEHRRGEWDRLRRLFHERSV